ncbi:MAG: hypothetical protein QOJ89_3927 [bacterium]|jgi:hypothetical protein
MLAHLLWLPTLLFGAVGPVRASSWQRPVDGPLLRSFALGPNPYARGWHRGVDLGAPPGAVVRSACDGRVSFAGRVPGPGGQTVSVRCGALVATYQRLGSIAVRAGQRLARGSPLGLAGRSGDGRRPHVHLGAREARSGRYVDPLTLLRGGRRPLPPALPAVPGWRRVDPPTAAPARPLARAPRGLPLGFAPGDRVPRGLPLGFAPGDRVPRGLPLGPAPGRAVARAAFSGGSPARVTPGRAGRGVAAPPGARYDPGAPVGRAPLPLVPWPVWAGLACVALALPAGGLFALRRRHRAVARHTAGAAARGA